MGQELELSAPALRIVSLVPSQTEFLQALGLEGKLLVLPNFAFILKNGGEENSELEARKIQILKRLNYFNPI